MTETKNRLQRLMDKQRKKSELYIASVQRTNRLKAESYNLYLECARCREELMTAQLLIYYKKNNGKVRGFYD